MKSPTIHGIERPLYVALQEEAKAEKVSLNKAVKSLLERSLGVAIRSTRPHRKDFEEFCGVWSKADLREFNERVAGFEKVDGAARVWQIP
jgi:hypothetical protein